MTSLICFIWYLTLYFVATLLVTTLILNTLHSEFKYFLLTWFFLNIFFYAFIVQFTFTKKKKGQTIGPTKLKSTLATLQFEAIGPYYALSTAPDNRKKVLLFAKQKTSSPKSEIVFHNILKFRAYLRVGKIHRDNKPIKGNVRQWKVLVPWLECYLKVSI